MNVHIAKAVALLGGQAALARACGLSSTAIHKLLHGQNQPSASTALAIERATGGRVTRLELLYPTESNKETAA